MATHAQEVRAGERFEFGKNWTRFLAHLTPGQMEDAEASLKQMLGVDDLRGRTFLDAGNGSGLFSLAARRMGARVHSFDFDPHSVACCMELRRRYYPNDDAWKVEEGSVLDRDYLSSLGQFDVVYSWGVLHHTGAMWPALENMTPLVAPGGLLFVAIYNDQGTPSRRWTAVKRFYNRTPAPLRPLIAVPVFVQQHWRRAVKNALLLRPFATFRAYEGKARGMTIWTDLIDWVGGYPFEVAKPEEIIDFYQARGFQLQKLRTCGGTLGCNEFVMRRQ